MSYVWRYGDKGDLKRYVIFMFEYPLNILLSNIFNWKYSEIATYQFRYK